ncbi:hypothetical protein [Sphaerisporangium aureirubrum]|uniref:Uncharacterized protein n=1 Tax=Sphaerisporangium aureirubrum TaxID=1544736 RepID=A0ABW1NSR1_9ACTN
MRVRRSAALLLWIGAALVPSAAHADDAADLRTVYCLSAAHREQVVEAAVNLALGTAVPGDPASLTAGSWTYTLPAWRTHRPADFERACSALLATVPRLVTDEEPGGLPPYVDLLLPVLAGALLTLAVQRVDAAVTRGNAAREALLGAASRFGVTAHEYVNAWIDNSGTPPDAVSQRAFELRVELLKYQLLGRHRAAVDGLLDDLPTGYDLNAAHGGGAPLNYARRSEAGREELTRVAGLVARAEALARRSPRKEGA